MIIIHLENSIFIAVILVMHKVLEKYENIEN